jgi:hypothetical protein
MMSINRKTLAIILSAAVFLLSIVLPVQLLGNEYHGDHNKQDDQNLPDNTVSNTGVIVTEYQNGWNVDQYYSNYYGMTIFVPNNYTFANSNTAIYIRTYNKSQYAQFPDLNSLINYEIENFKSTMPDVIITKQNPVINSKGGSYQAYNLVSNKESRWQEIIFGDMGNYFIIFTLNSNSALGYDNELPAFKQFIQKYAVQ